MQLVEPDPALVGFRQAAHRSGDLRLNPLELARDRHAGVERHDQHHKDDYGAEHERLRRRADEFHDEERDVEDGTARVGHVMEAAKDCAKYGARQHASVGRIRRLEYTEGRRRDEQAQDHHAAEPDNERRQGHVPDCEHPIIIIALQPAAPSGKSPAMQVASITEMLLRADARGEALGPAALAFLVRRYAEAGGDDIRGAVERGLTHALDGDINAAWIHTLSEAAAVTDDERIVGAVAAAARRLRDGWPSRGTMVEAMRDIDACLAAAPLVGGDLLGAAIDELERVVCLVYRPGERLPRTLRNPDSDDGGVEEHVASATALLTAHDVTARLPYSMLAEELTQLVRATGGPKGPHYARVLCRLARLHDDEDYRRTAVIARSTDYRAEAKAVLEDIPLPDSERSEDAAMLGLATDELVRAS